MRSFRIEILGACLAIATGLIVLMAMVFLAPLGELLASDPAERPLIRVGMTGAVYGVAILASGIHAFWNAKWSGLGLIACAVIGFLFGSRNPTVPLILLASAAFCLGGWYRAERLKGRTPATP